MAMKLHNLKPAPGSTSKRKRIGRGEASGQGKTAGRGHKGQLSRSGVSIPASFEGGQMPLVRRVPKRGFYNRNRKEYVLVQLDELNQFEKGATIGPEELLSMLGKKKALDGLKLLKRGELQHGLTVRVHKASAAAKAALEAAGGKLELIGEPEQG